MSLPISQPLIFGEVLFDEFDDGSQVLGGAPFNVAWHLKGFGLDPLFVSRIGNDETGEQVLKAMRDWGMNCEAVQADAKHPTGRVSIKLVDAQPEFDIRRDAAYDYITINELDISLASVQPSLLYHGSLAARSDISANTLHELKTGNPLTFVDINLRDPWWNEQRVSQLVEGVEWLKLNEDELQRLSNNKQAALSEQAQQFLQEHQVKNLVLTRGADGAWLFSENKVIKTEPVEVVNMIDTVGAGDAFSAVCLLGIIQQWPAKLKLQRASMFASAVCQQRGATVLDQAFYDEFIRQWQL